MSIVIDGIEQPKDCAHCRFALNQDYCIAAKKYIPHEVLISLQRAEFCTARPLVRGKWGLDPQCPVCGEDRYKGLDADIWACWEPPFCPNCGAMMGHYNGK